MVKSIMLLKFVQGLKNEDFKIKVQPPVYTIPYIKKQLG